MIAIPHHRCGGQYNISRHLPIGMRGILLIGVRDIILPIGGVYADSSEQQSTKLIGVTGILLIGVRGISLAPEAHN